MTQLMRSPLSAPAPRYVPAADVSVRASPFRSGMSDGCANVRDQRHSPVCHAASDGGTSARRRTGAALKVSVR